MNCILSMQGKSISKRDRGVGGGVDRQIIVDMVRTFFKEQTHFYFKVCKDLQDFLKYYVIVCEKALTNCLSIYFIHFCDIHRLTTLESIE